MDCRKFRAFSYISLRSAAFVLFALPSAAGRAIGGDEPVAVTVIPRLDHLVKAQRGPNGVIHVVADGPGGPRYARSTDDGMTFGPALPMVIATGLPAGLEFAAEDLAVGPDGRVHVALSSNAQPGIPATAAPRP